MSAVLVDTHAAIWYLTAPERLSPRASAVLEEADAAGDAIYVASISIVEMTYLVEKGRLPAHILEILVDELRNGSSNLRLVSLDLRNAYAIRSIPRGDVPDMPDRIIAAAAQALRVPLITRDDKIRRAMPAAVW